MQAFQRVVRLSLRRTCLPGCLSCASHFPRSRANSSLARIRSFCNFMKLHARSQGEAAAARTRVMKALKHNVARITRPSTVANYLLQLRVDRVLRPSDTATSRRELEELLTSIQSMQCQPTISQYQPEPLDTLRRDALTAFLRAGHLPANSSQDSSSSQTDSSLCDGALLPPLMINTYNTQPKGDHSMWQIGLLNTVPQHKYKPTATDHTRYFRLKRQTKNCLYKVGDKDM